MPERVQLSRRRGWRKPENTVSVARPTKWGNPLHIVPDGDAWFVEIASIRIAYSRPVKLDSVRRAVDIFESCLSSENGVWTLYPTREQIRAELAGKNLACWCPLDQPCHADVLLAIANPEGETDE